MFFGTAVQNIFHQTQILNQGSLVNICPLILAMHGVPKIWYLVGQQFQMKAAYFLTHPIFVQPSVGN